MSRRYNYCLTETERKIVNQYKKQENPILSIDIERYISPMKYESDIIKIKNGDVKHRITKASQLLANYKTSDGDDVFYKGYLVNHNAFKSLPKALQYAIKKDK